MVADVILDIIASLFARCVAQHIIVCRLLQTLALYSYEKSLLTIRQVLGFLYFVFFFGGGGGGGYKELLGGVFIGCLD